jgi:hypothetical protein
MSEMPARYRPDPWLDKTAVQRGQDKTSCLRMPRIALRDWLGVGVGAELGVAPADPRSVWIGQTVPRELAAVTVKCHSTPASRTAYIGEAVVRYLGVDDNDPVRFHRPDARGRIRLEARACPSMAADGEVASDD